MDATLQRAGTVSRPPGLTMLWVLLLCTLMAQCASAATTTTNSTITSSPFVEGRNGSSSGGHHIRLLVLKFKVVEEALIITLVVLLAGLSKIGKCLCGPLLSLSSQINTRDNSLHWFSWVLSFLKLGVVCYIVLWCVQRVCNKLLLLLQQVASLW